MNRSLSTNSIFLLALAALCFHAQAAQAQQGPVIVPDEPATVNQDAKPFRSILEPIETSGSVTVPAPALPNLIPGEIVTDLPSKSKTDKSDELTPNQVMDAGEKIDQLLTQLVLKNIPHDFTEDKDWGKQSERWDGLKVERDGLKIKTKRRKKNVNHGTWKKYSAKLINPNEEFSISVRNMHQTKSGSMGFDVHFGANLDINGRQSKWVKGVQLYSLSAEGHAKVRLKVEMEMSVSMDVTQFPPDLIFKPHAKSADIVVDEFRIDRVSKAGGEFAQQITRGVQKKLDEKVREKKAKLVKKINEELEEKKDDLRLSIVDAVKSKWAEPAKEFLPDSIQQAMGGAPKQAKRSSRKK